MPKRPSPEPSPAAYDDAPEPTAPDAYALPPDPERGARQPEVLGDEDLEELQGPPPRRRVGLKLAAAAVLVPALAGALLGYRAHHRQEVVEAALAHAEPLLALDTAAGYREAASLLEPVARLDPIEAGSARAFALAMLFADYRQADAEPVAEALLVEPGRAERVPTYANLAAAALALGRREAGTAATFAARAGASPWAAALQIRIAFLAGNLSAAGDLGAAPTPDAFAAGLALQGDLARRARKDATSARAAYAAALTASPLHPRAAFGLAKLALAGQLAPAEAETALVRLLGDRAATPGPERARAALHLAALRLRAGDRPGAEAAFDAAGLDAPARAWAGTAARFEATAPGRFRALEAPPAALQSAVDEDPTEALPPPPPPPPAPAVQPKPAHRAPATPAHAAKGASHAKKRAPTAKHGAKKGAKAGAKSTARKAHRR